MIKVFKTNRLYIPVTQIGTEQYKKIVEDNQWHRYTDEIACMKCKHKAVRPQMCEECPTYEFLNHVERVYTKGQLYLAAPIGYAHSLSKVIGEFSIVDRQKIRAIDKGYKFNSSLLREGQKEAVKILVENLRAGNSGVLKSPPRTGKTVMATAIAVFMKRRILFIAHQEDLLTGSNQLMGTLLGKTEDGKPFTNLSKFDPLPVKYCRNLKDFMSNDICLTTYQLFLHERGAEILEVIKDKFGLVIIDEVHRSGSAGYSWVLEQFRCPKLGLSATPKRKDGKHWVTERVVGPVLYETQIDSLAPRVSVVRTPLKSNKVYKNWVYMLRFLERHKERENFIVKQAYRDWKAGRSILIPIVHQSQAASLVKKMKALGIPAESWTGALHKKMRDAPLDRARSGETKVLVAQRTMLTGINVKLWDMLYVIVPLNNDSNFEQEVKRICTPNEGKPEPVVRFFLDEFEVVERCFLHCLRALNTVKAVYTKRAADTVATLSEKYPKNTSQAAIRAVMDLYSSDDVEIIDIGDSKPKKPKRTLEDAIT